MSNRVFTYSRSYRLSIAIAIALLAANVIVAFRDTKETSSVRRGDFPAFYAAAVIFSSGKQDHLYDEALQRDVQNHFFPALQGSFLPYAYPPFVAIILSPLAKLSPLTAKGVYTVIMIIFLGLTSVVITKLLHRHPRDAVIIFAIIFSFGPVLSGVSAAQNISISMMLYALACLIISRKGKYSEFLAGLALGFWLFKPSFAPLLLFLALFGGCFSLLLGALIPAALYYALGAIEFGWSWPAEWLSAARNFSKQDLITNCFQMVSIRGFTHAILQTFPFTFTLRFGINLAGLFLALIIFSLTAYRFLLVLRLKATRQNALKELFFLLGPAVILLTPHALYYDLGLCLIPCFHYLSVKTDKASFLLIIALLVMFLLALTRDMFPVSPMFVFAYWCYFFTYQRVTKIVRWDE